MAAKRATGQPNLSISALDPAADLRQHLPHDHQSSLRPTVPHSIAHKSAPIAWAGIRHFHNHHGDILCDGYVRPLAAVSSENAKTNHSPFKPHEVKQLIVNVGRSNLCNQSTQRAHRCVPVVFGLSHCCRDTRLTQMKRSIFAFRHGPYVARLAVWRQRRVGPPVPIHRALHHSRAIYMLVTMRVNGCALLTTTNALTISRMANHAFGDAFFGLHLIIRLCQFSELVSPPNSQWCELVDSF